MAAGRPKKDFYKYLVKSDSKAHVGHKDYQSSPASAFLKYTLEAKDAITLCENYFPKKRNDEYSNASKDSLFHITVAMLPAIMGHFETYQRYLFAGIFDRSIYLANFNIDGFFKRLKKWNSISIDPVRLSAYRGIGASSIGILLADNLSSWHNPKQVNNYFRCFGLKKNFYSNDACKDIEILWQLRHSIVHTGGTLTRTDAQKIPALSKHADQQILLEKNFTWEVSRKFHPIIKSSTNNLKTAFKKNLLGKLSIDIKTEIESFFKVNSSMKSWL